MYGRKSFLFVFLSIQFVFSNTFALNIENDDLISFQANTKAIAAEVNANFTTVQTAVNDNDASIINNSNSISTNAAAIATNVLSIKANDSKIDSNKDGIANNSSAIGINAQDIQKNKFALDDVSVIVNSNQSYISNSGYVGTQVISLTTPPVEIFGTTYVEALSVDIPSTGLVNVQLSAHIYTEISGGSGRYDFAICRVDCACSEIAGRTFWRPEVSATQADSISLTGFDLSITGPETYKLCVAKFDIGSPIAYGFLRGLNASWSP